MRVPPRAGPRRVEWMAMIERSPDARSCRNETYSWSTGPSRSRSSIPSVSSTRRSRASFAEPKDESQARPDERNDARDVPEDLAVGAAAGGHERPELLGVRVDLE